jgi:hypothetical protein
VVAIKASSLPAGGRERLPASGGLFFRYSRTQPEKAVFSCVIILYVWDNFQSSLMPEFGEFFKRNIDMVRSDVKTAEVVAAEKRMAEIAERLSVLTKKAESGNLSDQEIAEQEALIAEMEKQVRLKVNSSDIV